MTKWVALFILVTLFSLTILLGAFVVGWRMLGFKDGLWVLLMIYGYTGFAALVKELADKFHQIRDARR